MKIIKSTKPVTETENLEELFGRKKKAAPVPEKPGIDHAWDKHYQALEDIRQSGVSSWLAGMYFREGTNISDEEAAKIFYCWIENYAELAKHFHWKTDDEE
jgi:hypothetical protein